MRRPTLQMRVRTLMLVVAAVALPLGAGAWYVRADFDAQMRFEEVFALPAIAIFASFWLSLAVTLSYRRD